MDIGQAEITALESKGQLAVVDTELVQHGCVKVMHRDNVFDRVIAEFVRFTMSDSTLDTTSREPHRETVLVMITTRAPLVVLRHRCPAKFSAPNDQRVAKHVALL